MLRKTINRYVTMQCAMGFKYRVQNSLLQHFATYAEQCGDTHVRSQTVLEWAELAPSRAQRRNRLLTVRRFAMVMQPEDHQHEIPPVDSFGHRPAVRKWPHIFSSEEIKKLLNAASKLQPAGTIRPKTYTALFALLAATGLRISEALALNIDDITGDGLMIKSTKFRKDRLVPLHASTRQRIHRYLDYRMQYSGIEPALFISNTGARLPYSTVNTIFLQLARSTGLRDAPGIPGPRIHDLRHTFTVKSLEQCANDRVAISRHMTALSTYLGHAHISDTYWYLQATLALLTQISTAQEACYRRE